MLVRLMHGLIVHATIKLAKRDIIGISHPSITLRRLSNFPVRTASNTNLLIALHRGHRLHPSSVHPHTTSLTKNQHRSIDQFNMLNIIMKHSIMRRQPRLLINSSIFARKFTHNHQSLNRLNQPTKMLSYFGDPDVNRVSFLRGDDAFLQKALAYPSSVFVPFVEGAALHTHSEDKSTHLVTTTLENAPEQLKQSIGKCAEVLNTPAGRISELEISLTFLGLHQDVKLHANQLEYSRNGENYAGTPFFAINYLDAKDAPEFAGATPLGFMDAFAISSHDAALFSHAKMYIDWLARTRHCTGCGHFVYPAEAGTKVVCGNPDKSIKCPVRDARVSNFCFPRTDPISIVACVDADLTKVCLARSKRQIDDKHAFYSCVAGFMEPGETVEAACVRELWEETGVQCLAQDVELLGSQPWPYPANLMIGCLARVHFDGSNESVSLNHDPELMDARWFDIKDLCTAIDEHTEGFFMPFAKDFYLPGAQAIAYDILKYVADLYKNKNVST